MNSSLTKVGTGTLTLTNNNSYFGGTTIEGGTLQLGDGGDRGTITGNVVDGGTLAFNHSVAGSFSFAGVISDGGSPGAVTQIGPGTTTLSGANTYSGGTTISAGALVAAHQTGGSIDALGVSTSAITMNGGTLQFAVSGALANAITLNSGTGTISAGSQTVTINGALSANANTVLQLGKSGDTGTLVLVGAGGTVDSTAALVIAGGTVQDGGNAGITSLTFSAASTTVNSGATLDFNDSNNQAIHNLNGAGSVKMGNAAGDFLTLGVDGGTTQTFSGTISGSQGQVLIETAAGPGSGTMIFSGANTYGGGTMICSCAALQLGDATYTGSIVGAVNNEGFFNIVNANTAGITSITNDGFFGGPAKTTFFGANTAGTIAITNKNGGETDFGILGGRDTATAANATIVNKSGGVTTFNAMTIAGNATISNNNSGSTSFFDTSSAGSANITNHGGVTIFGTLGGTDLSTAGNATINNDNGGTIFLAMTNAGTAHITNANGGGTEFFDSASALSATIVNNSGGFTSFGQSFGVDKPTAGNASITNNSGGETGFNAFSNAGNATITTNSGGATYFYDNSTGGNAQFITVGTGFVDFSGSLGPNGDGRITAGSIGGSGFYYIGGGNTLIVGSNNLSTSVTGVIADNNPCGCTTGPGALEKVGAGTLTLSGINTYTGTTTVFRGFLDVEGSIASSVLTTVDGGGALSGAGIVGNTMIAAGGIFLPGNGPPGPSMTVAGNLAFQSGALYLVTLNSTVSTFAHVTGTATLAGTVGAAVVPGSEVMKQYMILAANGGVSGTFAGVGVTGPSGGLVATLSYDPTHAYLNFALDFGATTPGLNVNQRNVGTVLTNFFNANGGIPVSFATLTPGGLTQASGELATGSQQATFDAMNLFMGMLTDPFIAGRGDGGTAGANAPIGYASTQTFGVVRDAYAMFAKAPLAHTYDPRWSVWEAGFGGSQTTDGNAVLGSNTTTSRIAGTAVGADYRISPFTVAGFALAGGGTNFSVANSGSGHSDLFQAGAFIRHTVGPAYVSAALAYGWQDIITNRTVTVAGTDQLRAQFDANAFSGRLEGGYRFVAPWVGGIGITPYAAAQFTTFDLPGYAEQAIVGSNAFALAYNAKDVTDTRSELGLRTDKSWAMTDGIVTLRGRLAWAHDFNPDRSIAATFQTLPGASFVVNGAAQASDSALVTASLEKKWISGWSAAATFEGEFSDVTRSYAGKGVVRYVW